MKRFGTVLRLVVAFSVLLFAVTGCDFLSAILGNMTVQITTYDTTAIWTIEYKTSSTSTWTPVMFKDANGTELHSIISGDSTRPYVAYFSVSGPGTYDFRVRDALDGVISTVNNCACTTEISSDYDYTLTVSSAGVLSFL